VSVRAGRWLLFVVFALTLPLPSWGEFGEFAPALRYAVLFAAGAAVAIGEGATGPVPWILLLFGLHALAATALAGLAAWIGGRALARLAPRTRGWIVAVTCVAILLFAVAFEPYRTPFGRAPVSNLLGILS